ncbi:MAG TPA: TonB-dependent receptor, partial [Candidatus Cloacimonadota bacterium]|nr:TonB-dependent receptor [Candidatus Cloacimonadota bacterium]
KDNAGYPDWTPNWMAAHTAFAQHEMKLSERIGTTASIGITGYGSSVGRDLNFLTEPGWGVYYTPNDMSRTSLSLGHSTALPTLRQLFSSETGNPALKPARAWKSELSHQQNFRWRWNWTATTTVFYNHARDMIDLYAGTYRNINSMDSYGLELNLISKPLPWWETSLDYAWLGYDSNYTLAESPAHKAVMQNNFTLPGQVQLGLNSKWEGTRLSADVLGIFHALPSYFRQDLMLSRKWRILSLKLGVENALDVYYEGQYGYPAPGRNFVAFVAVDI